MMLPPIVLLLTVLFCRFNTGSSSPPSNEFECIQGCQQYYTDSGYFAVHPYMDTSTFKNTKTDDHGVTRLRFGVLGRYNAYVRFSSVSTNSNTPMTELALAGSWNKRSDFVRFPRTIPNALNSKNLASYVVSGMMSLAKPLMMTMAVHRSGLVTVTKDGESVPFMQFTDSSFSYRYMGIARWDQPVVLFFDCPLHHQDGGLARGVPASTSSSRSIKLDSKSCLKAVECSECSTRDKCFSGVPRTSEIDFETSNN